MKKLILFGLLSALAACSDSGDEIIFDKTLGPRTKDQVKTLPSDLRGDTANEQLSPSAKKSADLEKDGQ